jgi:CheY-like chemotaxis protein
LTGCFIRGLESANRRDFQSKQKKPEILTSKYLSKQPLQFTFAFRNRGAMGISILLADDDEDDHYFFREALKAIDPHIKITIAKNGNEALKILAKFQPELIFLDINMPHKDGKECLKMIRKNKFLMGSIVIMYTTSTDHADIQECFKLGANLYATKPSSQNEYLNTLQGILKLYKENKLHNDGMDGFLFRQPLA